MYSFLLNTGLSCLMVVVLNTLGVHAQTGFYGAPQWIDNTENITPTTVGIADLDGDGDKDIVSVSNDTLVWFAFRGERKTFDGPRTIDACDTVGSITPFISPTDLDGDGDQDIVASCCRDTMMVWYENTDGRGTFDVKHPIETSTAKEIHAAYTADLDNDGDLDLYTASFSENQISWYEHIDGQGHFGVEQPITNAAKGIKSLFAADLDGDGDQDLLANSIQDGRIAWYENTDGQGTFGTRQTIYRSAIDPRTVIPADMDGDGDEDIVWYSVWDHKIAWHEHTDGKGTFGNPQVIDQKMEGGYTGLEDKFWDGRVACYEHPKDRGIFRMPTNALALPETYLYASDLDGDGDQDILAGSFWDNQLFWYENTDGRGTFEEQRVFQNGVNSPGFVYAGDIDGDGDRDMVSASFGFPMAWYENTLPLEIMYNPADTSIVIDSTAVFHIGVHAADHYQWQVDTGNGFADIHQDDGIHSGAKDSLLIVSKAPLGLSGNRYRCVISNTSDSLVSRTAVLKVLETEPPTILSVPDDQVLNAQENCMALLPDYTEEVVAQDNIDKQLDITQTPEPGSRIPISNLEVTLTVTDDSGNSSRQSFNVEVADMEAPVVTSKHPDQMLEPTDSCRAPLPSYIHNLVASDNCYRLHELSITQSPKPYAIISGKYNEVVLAVTDPSGNSSQVVFNAGILDNVKPSVRCTEDQVFMLEADQDTYRVTGDELDPVFCDDNCGIAHKINNYNNDSTLKGATFPLDTTHVVWTVTDRSDNQSQCSFHVIVSKQSGISVLQQNNITVYPNPTSGIIYYEAPGHSMLQAKIFDLTGRLRFERTDMSPKGTLDLSRLNKGMHYLSFITASRVFTYKITKE